MEEAERFLKTVGLLLSGEGRGAGYRTTQIYYVPRLQIGKVKLGKPLTPWAKPHLCCAASRNDISVLGMEKLDPGRGDRFVYDHS